MVQFAPDGVPTIDGCRPAVLRVLADGVERPLRSIVSEAAELLGLSDDAIAQRLGSGQGRFGNRVGWACSSFYHAGLLLRPSRGRYRITDDGLAVDARGLVEYMENDLREWPQWNTYLEEIAERNRRADAENGGLETGADELSAGTDDPRDTIGRLVRAANDVTGTDLRGALQGSSPEFFERAVLEVLWAMGYGGGNGEKEHLGKSNDGGIDGVIRQDPLGLQSVYVQAKRYADGNTVGSPDINGFYGALARRNADRGVFITTSSFSPAAREAAEQFNGRIVLIDGIRLTSLMLQYGVGVEAREKFTIFDVNQDFFAE